MITKMIEKYLKNTHICPYCNSNALDVGKMISNVNETGKEEIYESVNCEDCKKKWFDIYTITGVK